MGIQKCQDAEAATCRPHHNLITTCSSVTHIHRQIITILKCMLNINMTDMEQRWVKLSTVLDRAILNGRINSKVFTV